MYSALYNYVMASFTFTESARCRCCATSFVPDCGQPLGRCECETSPVAMRLAHDDGQHDDNPPAYGQCAQCDYAADGDCSAAWADEGRY